MKPKGTHTVRLADINFDRGTQTRAAIDEETVAGYAAAMKDGAEFPAAMLFQDGPTRRYFIGDGWHRLLAAQRNGVVSFPATIGTGGRPAAIRHALGANAVHGLRRNQADKRHAIMIALRGFPNLSDREIAKICAVDHKTVASVRSGGEIPHLNQVDDSSRSTMRLGGDGKSYPATQPPRPPAPPARAPDDLSDMEEPADMQENVSADAVMGDFPMPPPEPPPPAWSAEAELAKFKRLALATLCAAPEKERRAFEQAMLAMIADLCGEPAAAPPKPKSDAAQAEEIFRAYPRKVGKKAAIKAIKVALGEAGFAPVLAATKAFSAAVAKWPPAERAKYVPHPATWFNRGSYEDDPAEWERGTAAVLRHAPQETTL